MIRGTFCGIFGNVPALGFVSFLTDVSSEMISLFFLSFSHPSWCGTVIVGILWQRLGPHVAFGCGAAFAWLAGLLQILFIPRRLTATAGR